MRFDYSSRDSDGGVRHHVIEADSRAAAFARLREQGISPLGLKESHSRPAAKGPRGKGIWLLVFLVTALVSVLVVSMWPKGKAPAEKAGKPPVQTPPAPVKEKALPAPAATPIAVKVPVPVAAATNAVPARSGKSALTPEDEGYVSPDPGFAERYRKFKEEQAKLPFKNISEFEIHRIISTQPGETILATSLPPKFEEDFLAHVDDPIVVNEDDTEEIKLAKRTMVEVKARLKELMAQGQSVREILQQEQEHLAKVATLRDNLYAELKDIEKTAKTTQEIDDFVAAANKMLEEYGAKHIKLPMSPARLRLLKAEGKLK